MHYRASKAADCRIQMHLNGGHRESLPQPNGLASKIPGSRQILNGAGNKRRANTAFYITTYSKSGMQNKQREGEREREEERVREQKNPFGERNRARRANQKKMYSRTYQKYNCRKQRLI